MPHLSLEQRYKISALKISGLSQKEIAHQIGFSPSTISRELYRNRDKNAVYEPLNAHNKAHLRAKKQAWKLTEEMKTNIISGLKQYFSPEQIWGKANKQGLSMVSIETIYLWVYKQKRLGNDLTHYLRWHLPDRRKRVLTNKKRGQIPDRVMIDERPQEVESRNRLGDFEIDLIIGKWHKMAILTAVDRTTRMLYAALIPNKESKTVSDKLVYLLGKQAVKTITSDNGKEFAGHKDIASALKAEYYFAHPYHSWERGTNENTNGLLRQFIPKNRAFCDLTEKHLQDYVDNINNRPRKIHGFKTSIEIFQELIQKIT